ncbi:hypothetical protein BHE74_00031850 [Ensete ventricosum]|nr:hypothetical protein BHE74_00031850 [Ensete ventricosum]
MWQCWTAQGTFELLAIDEFPSPHPERDVNLVEAPCRLSDLGSQVRSLRMNTVFDRTTETGRDHGRRSPALSAAIGKYIIASGGEADTKLRQGPSGSWRILP